MLKGLFENFLCFIGVHNWMSGNYDYRIWGKKLAYDYPYWRECKRKNCRKRESFNRYLGKWQRERRLF